MYITQIGKKANPMDGRVLICEKIVVPSEGHLTTDYRASA
jgi:hypothetical protein